MLQCFTVSSFAPLTQTPLTGSCPDKVEFLKPQSISKYRSPFLARRNGIFVCLDRTPPPQRTKKHGGPQNVDFPPVLPKNKKKPYPIPYKKIKEAARADKELAQMGIEKPLLPPKNGLLVEDLVPVSRELLETWKILIEGVAQLLHVVPIHACRECSEVHIAERGHEIQDCRGSTSSDRRGYHSWVKGSINDILVPIESYHMYDPFGKRIKHETRFNFDRIPAIVELCIQAGVDIPEYPSRRRTTPVRMLGKKIIDIGGHVDERAPHSTCSDFDTDRALERFCPPGESEGPAVARRTLDAFEGVKRGVRELMGMYTVKACGYCSEIHVGPWGHNVKLCGAFKHQWRDGKHGWQDATPEEVFPSNHVWHVRDPKGRPMWNSLKRFYGKAPAVVELCVQAGAEIPQLYKPMMRLDIVLPDSEEAHLVA
ncbi:hypothetical protein DM860_011698 [Cuscuta australis]|uniref:APO domain-containing protein n=1 Tax=Cuscuta australis TaxID=267555 RepID=A0A328DJR9_9ASTE|nr:hypothetical protein DM860_011698 [Cuscuta australis]